MTKRLIALTGLAVAAALSMASTAFADPPAPIENFTLVDQTGTPHALYDAANAPAVVIVTHANGDPTSREAVATIENLKTMFGKAEYFLLNSSQADTRETIAAEATALHTTLPILDDEQQHVARLLGASQTGEAFVIDPIGWKVVYRGPINAAAASDPNSEFLLFNALVYFMSHRAIDEPVVGVKGAPISFAGNDGASGSNH